MATAVRESAVDALRERARAGDGGGLTLPQILERTGLTTGQALSELQRAIRRRRVKVREERWDVGRLRVYRFRGSPF